MDPRSRPSLRAVESIVVPDPEHGRVVVLRDTQGITDSHAVLPPVLVPVVSRFSGALTCEEIAQQASVEIGARVPVDVVVRLAEQLDAGLFLEGPTFRAARTRVARAFVDAAVRPAVHAGAAYHGDARELQRYIDEACLAPARSHAGSTHRSASGSANRSRAGTDGKPMIALIAPHIDPWRGAIGYGHAYGALASAIGPEADTFIVLGTSHAPMREPFALCRKAFDTPFGPVEADTESVDALANEAEGFDPYADQLNHKREHSLEFQVVFLKHVLKERPFRIIPVLAGLGAAQSRGVDPKSDARIGRFIDGLRAIVQKRPGRVLLVAGADMAHVGPRFGDPEPYGEDQRVVLEKTDRESLQLATGLDAGAFWSQVQADLDERRVCGLAPIWSLLASLEGGIGGTGRVLHYEQNVDPKDGSIVSHAAVGFYG